MLMTISSLKGRVRKDNGRRSSSSDDKIFLSPGHPYLTKVNGKLVMARDKKPRPARKSIDLLSASFGMNTRVIPKKTKSEEKIAPLVPIMIGGVPYVPQTGQQQLMYPQMCLQPLPSPQDIAGQLAAPVALTQQPSMYCCQPKQFEPTKYTVEPTRPPTKEEIEELKKIDAHIHAAVRGKKESARVETASESSKDRDVPVRTTIPIAKHVCAGCGQIRSTKYHLENPIKPGETPTPAFCRKCRKDANSTSSEESMADVRKRKKEKDHRRSEKKSVSDIEDAYDAELTKSTELPKQTPSRVKYARATNSPYRVEEIDNRQKVKLIRLVRPEDIITIEGQHVEDEISRNSKVHLQSLKRKDKHIPGGEYVLVGNVSDISGQKPNSKGSPRLRRESSELAEQTFSPSINGLYYQQPHASTVVEETYEIPIKIFHEEQRSKDTSRDSPLSPIERRGENRSQRDTAVSTVSSKAPSADIQDKSSKDDNFESRTSSRSERRRHERLYPDKPCTLPPWEKLHLINPRPGQSARVTETWTFQPKRKSNSNLEDTYRKHHDWEMSDEQQVGHMYLNSQQDKRDLGHEDAEGKVETSHSGSQPSVSMHRATAGDYAYYQEDWVRDELYQEADQNARQPHPETYRGHEMEMLSQESEEQFHHSRVETLPSDFNDSEIQYQEAYCLPHRNIYFAPPTPSACSLDLDLLIGSWADEPVHKQHSTEKTAIKSCEESRIDKGNRSSTQNKGTSTRSSIRSIVKSKRIHSHESSRSSSSTESISRPNLNRQSTSPRRSYASQPAQPNDWPDVVRGDSHMRPSTYYPFYNQEPGALVPRLRVEQKDSSDNYTRHVSFRARPE